MSEPEFAAALLGLFAGRVRDLHEGKMLSPEPGFGPMFGFPGIASPNYAQHRGTLRIAEDLGVVHFHPTVYAPQRADGVMCQVGFPLLGDLLWYFEDDVGVYPRNWLVKHSLEDFERPFHRGGLRRAPPPRETERLIARLAIEEAYYDEVDVPSSRVTREEIPSRLFNNLRRLYPSAHVDLRINEDVRTYIVRMFSERIPRDVPVIETVRALIGKLGRDINFYVTLLFQAIWRHEIEVDMWSPILTDKPLQPSERGVADVYNRWFCRDPA